MATMKGDPCDALKGTPGYDYCTRGDGGSVPDAPGGGGSGVGGDVTEGASQQVKDTAEWLIDKIQSLLAPGKTWAPKKATDDVFVPFLWLGQHLAIAIFTCVVVVCALSAWQGAPRLKQMGQSTGWTMIAVLGMTTVPGAVYLLNVAVNRAIRDGLGGGDSTLFGVIEHDLDKAADVDNPLALMGVTAVLCVALGCAALVYLCRQPGILVFVCIAPVVLSSMARGGDLEAVQKWSQRLMGLMFAPLILILTSPFVVAFKGSLVMDSVLLIAADLLMIRIIFHGIPYVGPRMARAARSMVESRTDNRYIRGMARAAAPDFHEQENSPRGPRLVATPGRAVAQDADTLMGAFGVRTRPRPGRLTTASAINQITHDQERTQQLAAARRQ
ncbi:hypothetical protein, partial [Streptomyces sp. NPDC088785]|uniref:hypothetical protein n=1 Tax=Streptomyces sp. NPDC088785 TaxID=3365897 RepID=UPI00381E10A0